MKLYSYNFNFTVCSIRLEGVQVVRKSAMDCENNCQ